MLAILFLLSGFFMKYSDDLVDVNNNMVLASVFGIVCAVASAAASIYNVEAAYIFISILIGNLLALKIDGVHHLITLILFIVICLIYGIADINLVILLVCILAAFSDEVGHELISTVSDNYFLNLFFEYRFVMKIVVFLLAICGVFNILIFICFILFDLAYLAGGVVFEKLN